jgi:hypothetical protein
MREFSDDFNNILIITVFFLFYMYLLFRQTELKMTKKLASVDCNPLAMIVGSIFDEEKANKTFAACTEYTTASNVIKSQEARDKHYKKEVIDLANDVKKIHESDTATNKEKQNALVRLMNTKTDNVNDLVTQQRIINETISDSSNSLTNIVEKISSITGKLKDIFMKISN